MKVFIFEFATGGGLLDAPGDAPAELAALAVEGAAMVTAVAGDFAALRDAQVSILRDGRRKLPAPPGVRAIDVASQTDYLIAFDREATHADWTIVIAPECDGILVAHVERALAGGGRVLGPGPAIAALCGDKQATAEHLAGTGVPVPRGGLLRPGGPLPSGLSYPVVVKPCDGAGSQGVRLLLSPPARESSAGSMQPQRIEAFHPGLAASVACLCGPGQLVALPPCRQHLSDDGRFKYLGGALPLAPDLADRATRLARQALATLDGPLGYIGVDLVLGADPSGTGDVVIEINPRLTTSYVGLQAAARVNLAGAMLDVVAGRDAALSFSQDYLEFTPDGRAKPQTM